MKRQFTNLEDQICSELDEPFRSRFLAIAYRVNHRLEDDLDCYMVIRDGLRNYDAQLKLWARGRYLDIDKKWQPIHPDTKAGIVTNAYPGKSAHEYRRAAHIILLNTDTRAWLKDDDKRWAIIGEECARFQGSAHVPGVAWGGLFKSLYDPAHIEDWHYRRLALRLRYKGLPDNKARFEEELCPAVSR